VDELLASKEEYKSLTGLEYSLPPLNTHTSKVSTASTSVKCADNSNAISQPVATANDIRCEHLRPDGSVDFVDLEKYLSQFSYLGGYLPSAIDMRFLEKLEGTKVDGRNTIRWLRHIRSFPQNEQLTWK